MAIARSIDARARNPCCSFFVWLAPGKTVGTGLTPTIRMLARDSLAWFVASLGVGAPWQAWGPDAPPGPTGGRLTGYRAPSERPRRDVLLSRVPVGRGERFDLLVV